MTELSVTAQLRLWIRAQIGEAETVHLPTLADAAVAHFSRDKAFVRQFMLEQLRQTIYEIAGRELRKGHYGALVLGDEVVSRAVAEQRAEQLGRSRKFWAWYEHAGERHIRLPEMRRADLLLAAQERRARGQHELAVARCWEMLAEGLENDEQVQDRYTPVDIENLFAVANKEVQEKGIKV